MTQQKIFSSNGKSKTLVDVSLDELDHSKFNPRSTRPNSDIEILAGRMRNNGYEITRAMWAVKTKDGYEVFAGGTRLEAARKAKLSQVPIIMHTGFTDEEIIKLSDEDNENDEYHKPVPCVDVWLSYKALADAGWGQERIAKAKGVKSQSLVSERIQLAKMPQSILDKFINSVFINERHALELVKLSTVDNLSGWLTRETAMLEIIESELQGAPTAKTFKNAVNKYNEFIKLAIEYYKEFLGCDISGYNAAEDFAERLVKSVARSKVVVQNTADAVTKKIERERARIEAEAKRAADKAEQESKEASRKALIVRQREEWFSSNVPYLSCGDFRKAGNKIDNNSVDMIFTDPPYDEESIPLYGDLAKFAARVLKPGGSLIAYAGHYALPDIFKLMMPHLRYWWVIALEHGGNNARLPGKWVMVEWKPMVWFVKESRSGQEFVADHFKSTPPDKELHDWQQDVSEAKYYIEQLTQPGDMIFDPMCGSGTTLVASIMANRRACGIDINQKHVDTTRERLSEYYTRQS